MYKKQEYSTNSVQFEMHSSFHFLPKVEKVIQNSIIFQLMLFEW